MSDFTETPGGEIRQGDATVQESAGCSSAVVRHDSESSDDRIIANVRAQLHQPLGLVARPLGGLPGSLPAVTPTQLRTRP